MHKMNQSTSCAGSKFTGELVSQHTCRHCYGDTQCISYQSHRFLHNNPAMTHGNSCRRWQVLKNHFISMIAISLMLSRTKECVMSSAYSLSKRSWRYQPSSETCSLLGHYRRRQPIFSMPECLEQFDVITVEDITQASSLKELHWLPIGQESVSKSRHSSTVRTSHHSLRTSSTTTD